MYFIVRSDY